MQEGKTRNGVGAARAAQFFGSKKGPEEEGKAPVKGRACKAPSKT